MANFRIIKATDFSTDKATGTNYVLGVQGRVVTLSTLSFDDTPDVKLTVTDNVLSVTGCDLSIVKRPYVNQLGESVMGLQFMPKFAFSLDEI